MGPVGAQGLGGVWTDRGPRPASQLWWPPMRYPTQPAARPHCYLCDKARSMCLCRHLRPLPNTVGVHILQHPRERRHALGTARLLRLGLQQVQVHVLDLAAGRGAASTPIALPQGAGLLYPSEDARTLETLAPADRPAHIVIIDGTWAHANRIFRDNPSIQALPRFKLTPQTGSRYRIRKEPRLECLSTVESVVAALRHVQPDLGGTEMLDAAFDAMVDAQIEAAARPSTHVRKPRLRQRPPRHIPKAMLADQAQLLMVYAEAAPLRPGDTGPRRPLRISMLGPQGTVFDALVQTAPPPDAYEIGLMGLDATGLAPPRPYAEVMAAIRAFCDQAAERGPLAFVCWGNWTQRWLADGLGEVPCIMLKIVWANISKARVPGLDVVLERLGIEPPAPSVPGRAGRRLARAQALTQHILRSEAHAC